MSKPTFIDVKNITNVGRWWTRWKMLGGSLFGPAKPMQDLRNEEQLRGYRDIEWKRCHSKNGDDATVELGRLEVAPGSPTGGRLN